MIISKVNTYKKSLKRIIIVLFKKWYILVSAMLAGFFVVFIPLKSTYIPNYYASGALLMPSYVSNGLPTICDVAQSDDVINRVVDKNIVHKNGALITFSEIKSGISTSYSNSESLKVTISYSNRDYSVCTEIVNCLIDETLYAINSTDSYQILKNKVLLQSHAVTYLEVKNNILLYSVFACMGLLFLATFGVFLYDKKKPILYVKEDLEIANNIMYHEIGFNDDNLISDIISMSKKDIIKNKMLVIVSPDSDEVTAESASLIAGGMNKADKKTCVINFNTNVFSASKKDCLVPLKNDDFSDYFAYSGSKAERAFVLSSDDFKNMINKLYTKYDFIIFDFGCSLLNQDFMNICKNGANLIICGKKNMTSVIDLLSLSDYAKENGASVSGFIIKK